MKRLFFLFSLSALSICSVSLAWADSFRLGNPQLVASGTGAAGGTFANGTFTTSGTIPTSTAPFGSNNPCGADNNNASPGNCNTSWTFKYSAYTSVTSASVTLGLLGLDSVSAGNPVQAFTLTNGGGFDFTAAFNSLTQSNPSGRGNCVVSGKSLTNCLEYNIYEIDIT